MRPDLNDWRTKFFHQTLHYCEVSSTQPTSLASIVVLGTIAAAGAEAYRRKAPAISEFRSSFTSEPQLLSRKLSGLYAKAEDEMRLHGDIVAGLFRRTSLRAR